MALMFVDFWTYRFIYLKPINLLVETAEEMLKACLKNPKGLIYISRSSNDWKVNYNKHKMKKGAFPG